MALKMLNDDETAFFCEELAMILESGVSAADGIEVLAEEAGDKRFKEIAAAVSEKMGDNYPLFMAMEETGLFRDYTVKMIKIASVTGKLEDTLNGLSDYYSKRAELRQTIKNAVSHPLLLLAMMTAVIIVMVIKVIPMFGDIFARFDESTAAVVNESISFAYGLGTAVMIILLAVLAVTLVIALLTKFPAARKKLYGLLNSFVLTKGMSESVAMADVISAMSVMASCGLPSDQMLELAEELTDNKNVKGRIKECEKQILDGESFADAIRKSSLLPPIYAHSLKVAYKAGAFDAAWQKISDRMSNECDRKIYGAVSFIEPAIIGLLAIIIGAVLLSVMLPMTDIITAIG